MNAIDKLPVETEISLGRLLATIDSAGNLPLGFSYDDRPVRPGFHVTEVKVGEFAALDCGANPEAWSEIFVQLWDIDEDGRDPYAGWQVRSDHPQGVVACTTGRLGEIDL